MSAEEDTIDRSSTRLDTATFITILKLCQNQPWLEKKQSELSETIEICSSLGEQKLICDLLSRFTYISQDKLKKDLDLMADKITSEWKLDYKNTIISSINNEKYADSSSAMLWLLKSRMAQFDGWHTGNFIAGLQNALDSTPDSGAIILLDEFVGTGDSVTRAISWIQKNPLFQTKKIEIYVCVLAAMAESESNIKKFNIKYFASNWMKKGISDHYIGTDLQNALNCMNNIESKLNKKNGRKSITLYKLGYKKSESTYLFENGNPPNNVFPIFWWNKLRDGRKWNPILRRI
ncbi:phosphoribosyltransferase-like protein [Radicibacter daui]|uniref:phosphoribosyltransferase-like protein n=1 Tax=Radicibacter daui TaxID=3064829 RepID=UPI004046CEE2